MELLERDAQLSVLAHLLADAVAGHGRTVVVTGGPGTGKSAVLQTFSEQSARKGVTVAAATGTEFEADLPYGVIGTLLDQVGRPADRDAADVRPHDLASAVSAIGALITSVTESSPLLLVVDDVQWADPSTVRSLAYLARRIYSYRCLLVLAAREPAPGVGRPDVHALLADCADRRLDLPPLTEAGTADLVGRTAEIELEPEFAAICHALTDGNPLLTVLLAREIGTTGLAGRRHDVDELREVASVGAVGEIVRRRLDRGPDGSVELAQAVAVLGPSATLARVRQLAGLTPTGAIAAIAALAAEDLLVDAAPLAFTHPLLRTAVVGSMSAGARMRSHAYAGTMLASDGEWELAAHHYCRSEPGSDPATVQTLRRAADAAIRRGAPEEAVGYLVRALAEPPEESLRALVGFELGAAGAQAGMPQAFDHLRDALQATSNPELSTRIALTMGGVGVWAARWDESLVALEYAVSNARTQEDRDALTLQIVLAATGSARVRRFSSERTKQLRASSSDAGSPALRAALAVELAMTDGPAETVTRLALGALAELRPDDADAVEGLYEMTASVLCLADEAAAAVARLTVVADLATSTGNLLMASRAHVLRGFCYQRWQRPRLAEADLRRALRMPNSDIFNATQLPAAAGTLIEVSLDLYGADAARQVADDYNDLPLGDSDNAATQRLSLALARLALAERRPEAALRALEYCRAWEQGFGGNTVAFASWRPTAVRAHLMLEQPLLAGQLSEELTVLSEAFDGVGVRAIARHAAGLVAADSSLLRAAAELYADADLALGEAEALLDLGILLRKERRLGPAREAMRRSIEAAKRAGGDVAVSRAIDELRASGGRWRPETDYLNDLTSAEARAVDMAARGLTNREIARASFLSHRTVEMHLSHAYRKLGITNRRQLAERLGRTRPSG